MRYALFCWLLILAACGRPSRPVSRLFTQDSGFINKKEVLDFLVSKHMGDTAGHRWTYYDDTDVVGKYYRLPDGNVIACMKNMREGDLSEHLLLEITPADSIIKREPYTHWMYACCWDGFDGFMKSGDYFVYKACGTGTGYCSSNTYYFQHVTPQNDLSYVMTGYWNSMGRMGTNCSSRISSQSDLNGDTLTIHYKLEEFDRDDSTRSHPDYTIPFTVVFLKDEYGWSAIDSTLLKEYELY
ncbi:hypothetical protein HHL17_23540 [Chitinophaga sp. G-6-1-13]|uniref:Lipoprotein n=1 Tax=Chitinophaga fulva TaxID=2728842 RepID=A0A848GTY4_9BACT|nr:hypothetical protein [Chitinophaga fulva]NML40193.1 hypothetical protein [Chitinophaga fulva]